MLIAVAGYGKADTLILKDLSASWIPVSSSGEVGGIVTADTRQVFFELPENLPEKSLLSVSADQPIDIWVNGQLYKSRFSGSIFFPIDSILMLSDTIGVTVFGREGISGLATKLMRIGATNTVVASASERVFDPMVNAYLMILTGLILLTGLYKRFFPFTYSKAFSNPLTFKVRSLSTEESYLSFASMDNLFSVLYLACLLAMLLTYLGSTPLGFMPGGVLSSILSFWVIVVTIILIILLAKYLFSRIISVIFEFRGLANIQTQDFIHLSILVVSVFVILSLIDLTGFGFQSSRIQAIVRYGMVFSIVFFQFWIFLKVDKFYSHRKLMIFIYLCTTEFLPGFLTIYWLIG